MNSIPKLLLSTAYLPPVHYFSHVLAAEEIFIEQHETYPKQTYRNRCEIFTANGKLALTIPVIKVNGNHTQTKDITISDHQNWQIMHWRTIEAAYANSPYFLYYKDDLKPYYEKPFTNLIEFNQQLLEVILKMLEINKPISYTTSFDKSPPEEIIDMRNLLSPKREPHHQFKPYYQVFEEKFGFIQGLSILDLIFNMGEEAVNYLV